MRINDAVIGGILLAFAVALAAYSSGFPAIPGQEYGAAVFPTLIAVGLGGCGAVLVLSGLRRWHGVVEHGDWGRSPRAWRNLTITFGLVVFTIVAAEPIGFMPISVVVLGTLFLLLGTRWWVAIPVAILVTLLIHQVFAGFLRVPLPRGLFLT